MIRLIVLSSLILFSSAFAPGKIPSGKPRSIIGPTTICSSSISRNNESFIGKATLRRKSNKNIPNDSELFDQIRQELITKYVSAGHSQQNAETEVDAFLLDTQRSGDYVDMRIRAKQESDLGFEEIISYAVAFIIGVLFNFAAQYYMEYTTTIISSSEAVIQ